MRRISVRDRGGIYDHSELFEWISTTVSSRKTSRIDQIFFLFPQAFHAKTGCARVKNDPDDIHDPQDATQSWNGFDCAFSVLTERLSLLISDRNMVGFCMRRLPLLLLPLVVGLASAQDDFSELWLLGDAENGNQTEFSQERGLNPGPGSAEAQDDDFYFAGIYDDPIGVVGTDEPFVNYDRALTPGDTFNRIHFNLDNVAADPGTELRLTIQTCCLGAADGGESSHDLEILFNDTEIFTQDAVDTGILVEETFAAGDVSAKTGANVIHINRTGGSPSAWIQFDFLRLEAKPIDTDDDGLPDVYENGFDFLDSADGGDAALDEDSDTLTNLEEYQIGSAPDNMDTDGDGLNDSDEVRTHLTSPKFADTDSDGLNDAAEINDHGSNPNNSDTDGDTLSDGDEVNTHMTDPTLADSDADGVDDATEIDLTTDPNDAGDVPVLYTDLWLLGNIDNSQAEFSQETTANDPPGSPDEQDDDYYFAGTYGVGQVDADEDLANYDRALTDGDPVNRIHFNLDDISASEGAEYRVTVQLFGLGPAGESSHDVVMRLNDFEFFSQSAITEPLLVEAVVSGADAATKPGENILEIERTDGTGWIQFDYVRMEYRTDDTDRDGMPNSYESKFAFLNPGNADDAAMDEDDDNFTNLEEFTNRTEPDVADTDSDGLDDGDEVKTHGTLPRVADTDGDGLLDGEEISPRMTDPLDTDSDDDGLVDGAEIAAGSNPLEMDSDGDGDGDNDEVLYGSDPVDANSVPIPYEPLWQIGDDTNDNSNFTIEGGSNQPAPGSPTERDDDYYFAGTYPDPIGVVPVDEEWINFERALVPGDPFSRIHFNLNEEVIGEESQMRFYFELVQLGPADGDSIHDITVRVNGNPVYSRSDIDEEVNIGASFLPAQVGAVVGENIIEIERTGQSPASWIQFDFLRLEQRPILTDDPNLRVRTRGIFGELETLAVESRNLTISNTGSENALNISKVEIIGADKDHFSVENVPATLAPRAEETFTVTFDPQGRAGGFTAFLELTSDDSGDATVLVDLSALIPNTNGLVAHYPLDETEGTMVLDASGRGRHGTYTTTGEGQIQLDQPALATGKSVSFTHGATGAAFAEITDTFSPFVDVSLSLWFQATGDSGVLTLVSKNIGDSQGNPFAIAFSNGGVFVFAGGDAVADVSGVSANEPHHLVVTFDNSSAEKSIAIHVDGTEIGSFEDVNGFDDQANSPLVIGALNGSFGFQGTIDDLQIYNKILTSEDVAFLGDNPGEVLPGEVVTNPNADTDGDGQSDAAEEVAGTDPNDATSYLRVEGTVRADDGIAVAWTSVDGKTYVVEFSTTLNGDWTEVATMAATGASSTYTDTDAGRTGADQGFYRVRVQ